MKIQAAALLPFFLILLSGTDVRTDGYEEDFTKAENKYKQFRSEFLEIKMVNAEEAQKIVTAICAKDEDTREAESKAACTRAKSEVDRVFTPFERLKDETETALNTALASVNSAKSNSTEYKKNSSKINDMLRKLDDYSDDLKTKWTSIVKMTQKIRGGNHPVVAWMMEAGQAAHEVRQTSSDFLANEVVAGSAGRIDCLAVDGDELIIVELKPCNDDAKPKAASQLGRYSRELSSNWKSKYKASLSGKNAAFAGITKISTRCDCYTICPVITPEGDFEKSYIKWTVNFIPKSSPVAVK